MTATRTPSRAELIADLNSAVDKAKTLFDGTGGLVERYDDLSAGISARGRKWQISHAGGGWDLFEVDGAAHRHIDAFDTASKAVTFVVSILTDADNGPKPGE